MESQLKKLYIIVENVVNCRRELAFATGQFAMSAAQLATSEEAFHLARSLEGLARTEEKCEVTLQEQADADYAYILELIRDYLSLVLAVKEVLSERVKTFLAWQNAVHTLHKKREQRSRMELGGRLDKMGTAIEDVTEWEQKVEDSQDDMNLKEELLRGIYAYGFEKPSAIQQRAIVPCIKGMDVIAQAQSGTGKTATFSIAILEKIDTGLRECQALILAPTRELAQQIQKVVMSLGDYMGAQCHACIGGTSVREDMRKLDVGQHIVVGTPGRVFDMISRKVLRPNDIKQFVLDEADEMLSRGFKDQIYDAFRHLNQEIQVILLSATMPQEVLEVTTRFMRDPVRILVKKEELTLEGIRQFYISVEREEWKLDRRM